MLKAQSVEQYLNLLFERKIQTSPGYTLRGFAKEAGVSAAQMSLVLRGKAGLSRKTTTSISERLKLNKSEKEFFLALVDSQYSRSMKRREQAKDSLQELSSKLSESKKYQKQKISNHQLLEDWLHLTLFEIIRGRPGLFSVYQLSDVLGRSPEDVQSALDALVEASLIESTADGYACRQECISFQEGVPSQTIRKAHRSWIGKSIESLEKDKVEERNFGSYILGVEADKYPEICRRLEEVMDEFVVNSHEPVGFNRVYSLCFQLFPVTKRI